MKNDPSASRGVVGPTVIETIGGVLVQRSVKCPLSRNHWTDVTVRTVIAYIDGFNLYHGLRDKYARKFLWLDLEALCESLLIADQQLTAVNYFTAPVRNQPPALRRQQKYWNALTSHGSRTKFQFGRFQEKTIECRGCGGSWVSHEEKETDVGIAVAIVEDAANKTFDTALIVSADSDLCPAVHAVRRLHPAARLVAAFPPDRRSDDLRACVDASFTIARTKLAAALLPDPVVTADGKQYPQPIKWR